MKQLFLCLIIVFFILSAPVSAEPPEELFIKANTSYENKDYEGAVSSYEALVKMNKTSPEVFYNLGNSFFKLKKIGKAILNYERAVRLAPRDRDIRLNLKLAKSMAVDNINLPERGFILNAVFFLYDRMNINELAFSASIFYLFIILLLIFSIFIVSKRRMIFYAAGALSAVLIVLVLFLFTKIKNENFTKSGIVIAEKVDSRSGPKDDYLLQFTLHEGTKVTIVMERQNWYEIDLSKDLRGWVPRDSVDII